MSNFRKFCATVALLLTFSFTAQASSGWMSTGVRTSPTPEMKLTVPTEECEVTVAATEERSHALYLILEVSFTILRRALPLL